jgi:hypothetical protein
MVYSDDLENSHLTRPRKGGIWTETSEEKEQEQSTRESLYREKNQK